MSSNGIPSGILGLPHELLQMTFRHLGVSTPRVDEPLGVFPKIDFLANTEDIRNIRLTCRRFRDNSSHLLLPYLEVTASPASLDRLSAISNCPSVARGVLAIRVSLDFYGILDHRKFSRRAEDLLRREINRSGYKHPTFSCAREPEFGCAGELNFGCAVGPNWCAQCITLEERARTSRRIADSWATCCPSPNHRYQDPLTMAHPEPQRPSDMMALETVFLEYQREAMERQVCLQSRLVPAVTEAMTRMPMARSLCIRSQRLDRRSSRIRPPIHEPSLESLGDMVQDPLMLARHLLLPKEPCLWENLERPRAWPIELLYKLPASICMAGVSLRYLDIDIMLGELKDRTETAPLSAQETDAIRAVANNLTAFRYDGPLPMVMPTAVLKNFLRCLKTFATGSKLRNLHLERFPWVGFVMEELGGLSLKRLILGDDLLLIDA